MSRSEVLITGAAGFLGRHLCRALRKDGHVIGVDLAGRPPVPEIEWRALDSPLDLAQVLDRPNLSHVVHLAFFNRKRSGQTDRQYLEHHMSVDASFFEAASGIKGLRMILPSSSAVYGRAGGRIPVTEAGELRPVNIYGLAKVFQEHLVKHYAENSDMTWVILRIFNLIGPGQNPGMLIPDWARKVRAFLNGETDRVEVPHMKTSRDFVDVRDAASAIGAVVEDFTGGEIFNIAGGRDIGLASIAEEFQTLCRRRIPFIETQDKPASDDVSIQVGDIGKIRRRHHWAPRYSFAQSLRDYMKESGDFDDAP